MNIKPVKDNKVNEYPTNSEVSKDDERLKKPLKKWVKIGIGLIAIITVLATGIYMYESSIVGGEVMLTGALEVATVNSTLNQYTESRLNNVSVKSFVELVNNMNKAQTLDIPLIIYFEEELYSTEEELQKLSEKFVEGEYYEITLEDNKPLESMDGSYDTIYITKIVDGVE